LHWMASGYAQPVEKVTDTAMKFGVSLLQ